MLMHNQSGLSELVTLEPTNGYCNLNVNIGHVIKLWHLFKGNIQT